MKSILIALILLGNTLVPKAQEKSLLWTISKDGMAESSYLYGTIHIKDERAYHLSDCLLPAINDADVLALELNLDDIDPLEFQRLLFLPDEQTLADVYSESEMQLIDSVFQSVTGYSLSPAFMQMQPFAISMIMTESYFSSDYAEALDMYLNNYAKENKIEVVGLEMLEDQLILIEDFKPEFLLDELQDLANTKEQLEMLMIEYDEGDVDALVEVMQKDIANKEEEIYLDNLLFKRNETMTDRIIEIVEEKQAVVAVGAGHLGGEKGIIQLLRKKGYTVKALICEESYIVKDNVDQSDNTEQEDWFEVAKDNFSISFPSEPTFDVTQIPSGETELSMNIYMVQDEQAISGNIMYFLATTEFPDTLINSNMSKEDIDVFLDESMKSGIAELKGTIIEEENIEQNGYPGKKIIASIYGGMAHVHLRTILYNNELFFLQVMSMQKEENATLNRFYQSLDLKE